MPPWEITTLRVVLVSFPSDELVTFRSTLPREKGEFSLTLSVAHRRLLEKEVGNEVEITARLLRDDERVVQEGEVLEARLLDTGDPLAAWQAFHRAHSAGWDQIEDVEMELGRKEEE